MEYKVHYEGTSGIMHHDHNSQIRLAPNVAAEEHVYLNAVLAAVLGFREAFGVFDSIITSDMREQLANNGAFDDWLLQQFKFRDLAKKPVRKSDDEEMAGLKRQLREHARENRRNLYTYFKAQKRYLKYKYEKYLEAMLINDPWLTIHPDEVSLEAWAPGQTAWARIALDMSLFENVKELSPGTTQISYTAHLSESIEKLRDYRQTQFIVSSKGFNEKPQAGDQAETVLKDNNWIRGLLQISAAMTEPMVRLKLQPIDLYNLVYRVKSQQVANGPNALRYELVPGEPVRIFAEPSDSAILCAGSGYEGENEATIRHWDRHMIVTLERLIPVAQEVEVCLLQTGWPVFYIVRMQGMTLTLGLSGWHSGEWSKKGYHDLLAPRKELDDFSRVRVLKALREVLCEKADTLASTVSMPVEQVRLILDSYAREGRVLYDLAKNLYRYRPLPGQESMPGSMRYADEIEAKARYLVEQNQVSIDSEETVHGWRHIAGTVTESSIHYQPDLYIDANDDLKEASCFCHYFSTHGLENGPCVHMLAVRMLDRQSGQDQGDIVNRQ